MSPQRGFGQNDTILISLIIPNDTDDFLLHDKTRPHEQERNSPFLPLNLYKRTIWLFLFSFSIFQQKS